MVHHFQHRDGTLFAEDVNLNALAAEVGTPFYVYSSATLRRHVRVVKAAFEGIPTLLAYAMKANSNQAVLKLMASEGAGADVVSRRGAGTRFGRRHQAGDDRVFRRRQDRRRNAPRA